MHICKKSPARLLVSSSFSFFLVLSGFFFACRSSKIKPPAVDAKRTVSRVTGDRVERRVESNSGLNNERLTPRWLRDNGTVVSRSTILCKRVTTSLLVRTRGEKRKTVAVGNSSSEVGERRDGSERGDREESWLGQANVGWFFLWSGQARD